MIASTLSTDPLLLSAISAALWLYLHISWLMETASSHSIKNGFIFIIPVPRWQSVGVQMFMNINSDWMVSFSDRNNSHVLCWFPCGVVRLKENNLYHTNFVKWLCFLFFFLDLQRHDILSYCENPSPSFLHNRGRTWSVTSGPSRDTRPHGWTAPLSSAAA